MSTLYAEARFALDGAHAVIDDVVEHLGSGGFAVDRAGPHPIVGWRNGKAAVALDGDFVTLKIEAPTLLVIAVIKDAVVRELVEHRPELADRIAWSGDGGELTYPAQFSFVTVARTTRLTPHMQRIRFTGDDLGRYAGFDDIHMHLLLPRDGDPAPRWPSVGPSGVVSWPPEDVLPMRKYTVRAIDAVAGHLDVDMVRHGDAGPGSAFAERAKVGDVVGMIGNGGKSVPMGRDWYLLAGDETALPAIGRFLETLPPTARGVALIEVADAAEEQAIHTKTGIDIRWLRRDGAASGTTTLLPDAVRAVAFPSEASSPFVWAGCEFAAFKAIRGYLRNERRLKAADHLVVAYWRRSGAGDEHGRDQD